MRPDSDKVFDLKDGEPLAANKAEDDFSFKMPADSKLSIKEKFIAFFKHEPEWYL
jgi:hypothetical protein